MGGKAKTEKMSVTLPKELAGEIRSITSQGEISSFFTEALEHYIAYRKQKIALEKGFGAWKSGVILTWLLLKTPLLMFALSGKQIADG